MGISMVGVLMALIITWFMFKNEYFNFGKVDNSNSNSNNSSNSSSSSSYFNSDINFFD
jgi:hypothetical protein